MFSKNFRVLKTFFFCEFNENLRNSFLTEQLQMTASVERKYRRVFRTLPYVYDGGFTKNSQKSSFKKIEIHLQTIIGYRTIPYY